MKYLVMIQARCGSSRLPNKVLKPLAGEPALLRMIERVKQSKLIDEVMVITSINKENLPILKLCSENGIRVGVGSEDDVLDRYYQTARLLKPEYVIRLTADCPCFDAELLDMAIESLDSDTDYLGMMSETFADGLDLEIIRYDALEEAWSKAKHSFEREHVTQYIIRRPDEFICCDFVSPIGDFGNYRWTVDEPEDYEVVNAIYNHFVTENNNMDFGYKDIIDFIDSNPEIKKINSMYTRNEGLAKSIREDKIVK
ncbi:MAG: glycosyltransferase family protein [Eubacterium sp.]|nr:glycosyltransferase family protein [Eubacterium sp.]